MKRIRHPVRSFASNAAGTSAIEFALLSPLFLLIVMGMLAYGIYFGASHSVQQIAADTARVAIAGLDADERRSLATNYVERNAGGYAFIVADRLAVEVGDSADVADQFAVTVSYDARELPVWNLFEGLALPDMTITRRSLIRIGGV